MSSLEHLQNGRYDILKKLGEGGKGTVYKARDTVLNRVVAIKMLKSATLTEETYSRFLREAQAVAKLNHPNIVSIHDIGKEDERQFFVLEFVDGMSLRDLMKTYPEGKCDIQTVLRVGIDICNALRYAHSQGVLHRDIKPENILITQEGTAKLMDFGLSTMLGQPGITKEGIIVGTVAYVAPENALGKGADIRSDLYSFGAVLYEIVTGRPPFSGEDPVKIIFSHIHDYPSSPSRLNPKVPHALSECIMKLLEKEPGKRYQNADDLLKVLREIAEEFLREVLLPSPKPSAIVPAPRPSAIKEIQLIDRIEEMGLLRQAVDRAVRSEGGVVFLYGEAGIGKTRLTRELGAYARLRGMQVLSGRCPALFRMDGVPPYVLWKEVIKNYLETCAPQLLYKVIGFYPSEVSKLVPEIAQKLGAFPQSLSISSEHERDRLFEAVSQFITNISKETPLLVILDDLQWTDQSSLLLLNYLARGIYKETLLLLGTYRDTDIDEQHPLSQILTEFNRERLLQSVPLKRMPLNDVSEMIKQILEQEDIPREFCKIVYEKTRGNPFFVEEVIKSLKEEEIIYREEGKWKIKETSAIEFPKTVRNVIKTRISRLDDECQSVLTLASFVGSDFSFEALCGVTGLEEDRLLQLMEKTLKTGLVKERVIRGEDVYSFADIIVRDVVHEEVSHLRHKKLHGMVGYALEKVYAKKIDEHLGELALHFLEGDNKEKALDYFLKAGEKAQLAYAHDEAFSYIKHALELHEEKEADIEEKARVSERLGDIKALTGEIDTCMEYWNKSLILWNQLRDKKSISRLHTKMAKALWDFAGDKDKAFEHHNAALKILENEPESVELASLYQDISHRLWRSGKLDEASTFAKKAFDLAKKLGNFEIISECYNDLAVLSMKSGDFEKANSYYEEGLKVALENNFTNSVVRFCTNACQVIYVRGEFQKAIEMAQKGFELAKKLGDVHMISWIGMLMAWGYIGMGEMQKAFSLLDELLVLSKRTKNTVNIASTFEVYGMGYLYHGEFDKSLERLMEAREIAKTTGEYQSFGEISSILGELFMEMEDYSEAEKYFNESISKYEDAGDIEAQITPFLDLSKLHLKKGETEKAEELIEKASQYMTKTKSVLYLADVEMLKGMLFREQKNWAQSTQRFEKSLQIYKSLNAQKWYVYKYIELLYEYGLMYLEKNEEGDKQKAYSLLDQALEICQRVEAKKRTEDIIAKKKLLTA